MAAQTGLEGYELYSADLVVPAGVTLTVEPGVAVMAKDYELRVGGQLEAVGTAAQPITFTSAADSGPGQWEGLVFYGGFGDLEYVTVRYGGRGNSQGQNSNVTFQSAPPYGAGARIASSRVVSSSHDGFHIDGGVVIISDTLVADSAGRGIYVDGLSLVLDRTTVQHNGGHGVRVDGGIVGLQCSTVYSNTGDGVYVSGTPLLMPLSSAFYENGGMGLNNTTASTVTATYNYWGAADGPGGVGPGSGDEVSAKVEYDPWLPFATCMTDLSIAEQDTPDPVAAGHPLTYTIVITNGGPGVASAVRLTDTLPAQVTFATATSEQGTCQHTNGFVICDVGNMNSGARVEATIVVTPTALQATITNTVVVNGSYDPFQQNNTATGTTLVTPSHTIYLPLVLRGS